MSLDQVCLTQDNTTCLNDYKLLSVYRTSQLKAMKADGILGLAPSSQRTQAQLFVERLYDEGIIDQKLFSFYITKGEESSRVTFGGYDLKYAAASSKDENATVTWNDLTNVNYWSLNLVDVKVGQ